MLRRSPLPQTFTGTTTDLRAPPPRLARSTAQPTLSQARPTHCVAGDCGKTIIITNASAITLTTLNSLPIGCAIAVEQGGAGQITVANGSGATNHSAHSYTKTSAQWAIIGLFVIQLSGTAAVFNISGDGA